jgi:hypothetical protein
VSSAAEDVANVIGTVLAVSPEAQAIEGIVEGIAVSVEKTQAVQIIAGLLGKFFTTAVVAKMAPLLTAEGAADAQAEANILEDLKFPKGID